MKPCCIAVDTDDIATWIDVPSSCQRATRHHEVVEDSLVDGVALRHHHVRVEADDELTIRGCTIVHGGEFVDLARLRSGDHDTIHAAHCVMVVAAAEDGAVGKDALGNFV